LLKVQDIKPNNQNLKLKTPNETLSLCYKITVMMNSSSPKRRTALINVEGVGTYEVPTGSNLRETLRREGVYIDGTCADKGICGRCLVRVLAGDPGEPTVQETGLLTGKSAARELRLACRITVSGDLSLSVDKEHMLEVDRTGRWKDVWGSPVWMPELIQPDGEGSGIAVDLGTTVIATCLLDLPGAGPLDIQAAANPQMPWGDEIISRLDAARRDREVAGRLRDLVWATIGDQVHSLCSRNGISSGRIKRMVIVGNSAMNHLCLGLPVEDLLTPPYSPHSRAPVLLSAGQLPVRLALNREAMVYFPPLVGGYAGSDALASLLAVGNAGVDTGALLDVGTNTEIAVWKRGTVVMATAPSGPAFEGGHIRHGMRAEEGAVWKMEIGDEKVDFEVVGGGRARGICGTGMIDAIASMLRRGILEPSGLLVAGSHPQVNGGSFVLTGGEGISLEAEDVATIQKAKSAVASTWQVLLKTLGVREEELDRVFLAGAFGNRLNIINAMATGLLPALAASRYILAGNTALVGASMMLLSQAERHKGENLSRIIRHHNAAEDPDFEDYFIDNLYFPRP